jgi:hypothetical protein
MQDEEITLFNGCTDLVSLAKWEAFPLRLLADKRPGEWVRLLTFCQQIGVPADQLKPELFATWLPDPMALEAYAVILFYDDESKWSMAAHYNRGRFLGNALPNLSQQPIGSATLDTRAPAK